MHSKSVVRSCKNGPNSVAHFDLSLDSRSVYNETRYVKKRRSTSRPLLIVLGFRVEIRQHKSGAGVECLATLPLGARQKGNRKCGL
jgi:hypothetical protein